VPEKANQWSLARRHHGEDRFFQNVAARIRKFPRWSPITIWPFCICSLGWPGEPGKSASAW